MATIDPQTKSGAPQPMQPLLGMRDKSFESKLTFTQHVRLWLRWQALKFSGLKVADWMGIPKAVQEQYVAQKRGASHERGGFAWGSPGDKDPDSIVDQFKNPILNPVLAFHEALFADGDKTKCRPGNQFAGQRLKVSEAWLFCGQTNESGQLLRDQKIKEAIGSTWPSDHKIKHVQGDEEYRKVAKEAYRTQRDHPKLARESRRMREAVMSRLTEDGFLSGEDFGGAGAYDPNQYSEFAPLMGGPFYRQLYMYDFLKQIAYAFEAVNHNPIAKAIIRILTQYALGRRFDVRIKDDAMNTAWTDFNNKHKIIEMICTYWGKEAETYGDFILDTDFWESVDPSTIWDIITDAEHVNDEYYYYQSYPTAYQMFTGFNVAGEPGAEKQKASDYIVRQIPANKLLHMKLNCMSNEKRGRSSIFAILGWLKRFKDLMNAQVIREWLYSCFMWDIEINGSQSDINNYLAVNSDIPLPGSRHVHNTQVKMTPLPAMTGGTRSGSAAVYESLLCFIAVSCGIPKEFLNIVSNTSGSGSRAGALTSAEPFTKMVEDIQARWESMVKDIFVRAMAQSGIQAKRDDVEVLFPSVTKDSTTDMLNNLATCEQQGWIDNQTAGEMAAKELNITEYDYDAVQKKRQKLQRAGYGNMGMAMPTSRFGGPNDGKTGAHPGGSNPGGSQIHGSGAQDLKDELTSL